MRMRGALDHHPPQSVIKWMSWIGTVEPVIAVAAAGDQVGSFKLGQLILHSLEGEKGVRMTPNGCVAPDRPLVRRLHRQRAAQTSPLIAGF